MRVLFVTSEVATIYKLGGLGDVSYALPAALRRLRVDIQIALPFFTKIHASKLTHCLGPLAVSFDGKRELVFVFRSILGNTKVPLLLFRHSILDEYKGEPPLDSVTRFAFFSKVAATYVVAEAMAGRRFDIVHCNDWHTSLVPLLLGESPKVFFHGTNHHQQLLEQETLASVSVKSILTIHNPVFQGTTGTALIPKLSLDKRQIHELYDGKDRYVNLLREGLEYADVITTVSPTFAREMLATNYGPHVTAVLHRRKDHVLGILNGIDETEWDPATDAAIPVRYTAKTVVAAKKELKKRLQQLFRLPRADLPLFGFVGRLDKRQKGLDILLEAVEALCRKNRIQFVMLGTEAPATVKMIERVQKKYEKSFAFVHTFDERLARKIYAGSDVLLVPSRYEPCGLTQIIAMRYGTIPLVRKTGGLADSVVDGETGFVFGPYTGTALLRKMEKVISVYQKDPKTWAAMIASAMRQDFSWKRSGREYVRLYRSLLATKGETLGG